MIVTILKLTSVIIFRELYRSILKEFYVTSHYTKIMENSLRTQKLFLKYIGMFHWICMKAVFVDLYMVKFDHYQRNYIWSLVLITLFLKKNSF